MLRRTRGTACMISLLRQKKVRDLFWQAAVLIGVLGLVTFFVINASRNMRDAGIRSEN